MHASSSLVCTIPARARSEGSARGEAAVDKKYVCQIWVRQTSLPPDADGKEDGFGMGHKLLAALYDKWETLALSCAQK